MPALRRPAETPGYHHGCSPGARTFAEPAAPAIESPVAIAGLPDTAAPDGVSAASGPERLDDIVGALARGQRGRTTTQRRPRQAVGPRLQAAEDDLRRTYETLARDAQQGAPVTHAAEWILDNFYLVAE